MKILPPLTKKYILERVKEEDIIAWCKYNDLTFINCACRFTEKASIDESSSKRKEMKNLVKEMRKNNPNVDYNIYKALDNLEALIQHNESDIDTWIPLEYDLQMTYGNDKVEFSKYLTALRDEVRNESRRKIACKGEKSK